MKIARFTVLTALTALIISASSVLAAPCASVESVCASTAYQKVDALLGEKIVADQLQALGLSSERARARVSQLNEQQLQQLAAQADLIQAGGTIEGGNPNPLGPLGCMWRQLCTLCTNVYHLVFCWCDLK